MDAIFVGRVAQLTELQVLLDRATYGTPTIALIEGPAGAGKSALIDRFAGQARTLPAVQAIRVSGDESETAIAYGVYDQFLARIAGAHRNGSRTRPRATATDQGDLQTLGEALRDRLHAAAVEGCRLLLIVDDAHLADRPSLTALGFALRRLHSEPVLTILTTRAEESGTLPRSLLALADADGSRIALGGLTANEIRDLAAQYGQQEISERSARRLREHTGGSPLHLRALFQDGRLRVGNLGDGRLGGDGWLTGPLPAPTSFARLVADRLRRLSPAAQRLARAAAVLGLRCQLGAAAKVAGLTQDAGLAEPHAAADELCQAQIAGVESTLTGPELVFEHSMIRAAVLADSGQADLAAAYRAAATVTCGAESLSHRARATAGHDRDLADLLATQARDDVARGGWRTAATALLEAARLHPDQTQRDALLIRGVYALLVAGDLAVAGTYRDQVAALPASAYRLQVQALMAWMSGEFTTAEEYADRAWCFATDLDPLERDRLAGLLAQMYIMQGKSRAALAWTRTALDSGLLDPGRDASTMATLVGAMLLEGRVDEALALLPTEGDPNDAGYRELVGMRGILQMVGDDPAAAAANLRIRLRPNLVDHRRGESPIALLTATGPDGIEPNKLVVLLFLAEAEFRRGRWEVAAAIADQALGLIEDTEQTWVGPWAHAVAVLVPAGRGQWELAEAHLSAAEESAARLGNELNRGYTANAAVHLAFCRGEPERVVAAASWLLDHGKGFHAEPGLHGWPVQYADALVTLGRQTEADAVLGRWDAVARQRGRRSRIAALARVRGDLAARRRDLPAARAAYQEAFELAADTVDALEGALLRLSRGRFRPRRGERRAAIDDLRDAECRFAGLGAEPFLGVVRGELGACGIDHEPEAAPVGPLVLLTPQEGAVARLVADGRSNKEIAEALVLSPKTVAYHLGHVYAKLRVRSRSQLLAQRPFDP